MSDVLDLQNVNSDQIDEYLGKNGSPLADGASSANYNLSIITTSILVGLIPLSLVAIALINRGRDKMRQRRNRAVGPEASESTPQVGSTPSVHSESEKQPSIRQDMPTNSLSLQPALPLPLGPAGNECQNPNCSQPRPQTDRCETNNIININLDSKTPNRHIKFSFQLNDPQIVRTCACPCRGGGTEDDSTDDSPPPPPTVFQGSYSTPQVGTDPPAIIRLEGSSTTSPPNKSMKSHESQPASTEVPGSSKTRSYPPSAPMQSSISCPSVKEGPGKTPPVAKPEEASEQSQTESLPDAIPVEIAQVLNNLVAKVDALQKGSHIRVVETSSETEPVTITTENETDTLARKSKRRLKCASSDGHLVSQGVQIPSGGNSTPIKSTRSEHVEPSDRLKSKGVQSSDDGEVGTPSTLRSAASPQSDKSAQCRETSGRAPLSTPNDPAVISPKKPPEESNLPANKPTEYPQVGSQILKPDERASSSQIKSTSSEPVRIEKPRVTSDNSEPVRFVPPVTSNPSLVAPKIHSPIRKDAAGLLPSHVRSSGGIAGSPVPAPDSSSARPEPSAKQSGRRSCATSDEPQTSGLQNSGPTIAADVEVDAADTKRETDELHPIAREISGPGFPKPASPSGTNSGNPSVQPVPQLPQVPGNAVADAARPTIPTSKRISESKAIESRDKSGGQLSKEAPNSGKPSDIVPPRNLFIAPRQSTPSTSLGPSTAHERSPPIAKLRSSVSSIVKQQSQPDPTTSADRSLAQPQAIPPISPSLDAEFSPKQSVQPQLNVPNSSEPPENIAPTAPVVNTQILEPKNTAETSQTVKPSIQFPTGLDAQHPTRPLPPAMQHASKPDVVLAESKPSPILHAQPQSWPAMEQRETNLGHATPGTKIPAKRPDTESKIYPTVPNASLSPAVVAKNPSGAIQPPPKTTTFQRNESPRTLQAPNAKDEPNQCVVAKPDSVVPTTVQDPSSPSNGTQPFESIEPLPPTIIDTAPHSKAISTPLPPNAAAVTPHSKNIPTALEPNAPTATAVRPPNSTAATLQPNALTPALPSNATAIAPQQNFIPKAPQLIASSTVPGNSSNNQLTMQPTVPATNLQTSIPPVVPQVKAPPGPKTPKPRTYATVKPPACSTTSPPIDAIAAAEPTSPDNIVEPSSETSSFATQTGAPTIPKLLAQPSPDSKALPVGQKSKAMTNAVAPTASSASLQSDIPSVVPQSKNVTVATTQPISPSVKSEPKDSLGKLGKKANYLVDDQLVLPKSTDARLDDEVEGPSNAAESLVNTQVPSLDPLLQHPSKAGTAGGTPGGVLEQEQPRKHFSNTREPQSSKLSSAPLIKGVKLSQEAILPTSSQVDPDGSQSAVRIPEQIPRSSATNRTTERRARSIAHLHGAAPESEADSSNRHSAPIVPTHLLNQIPQVSSSATEKSPTKKTQTLFRGHSGQKNSTSTKQLQYQTKQAGIRSSPPMRLNGERRLTGKKIQTPAAPTDSKKKSVSLRPTVEARSKCRMPELRMTSGNIRINMGSDVAALRTPCKMVTEAQHFSCASKPTSRMATLHSGGSADVPVKNPVNEQWVKSHTCARKLVEFSKPPKCTPVKVHLSRPRRPGLIPLSFETPPPSHGIHTVKGPPGPSSFPIHKAMQSPAHSSVGHKVLKDQCYGELRAPTRESSHNKADQQFQSGNQCFRSSADKTLSEGSDIPQDIPSNFQELSPPIPAKENNSLNILQYPSNSALKERLSSFAKRRKSRAVEETSMVGKRSRTSHDLVDPSQQVAATSRWEQCNSSTDSFIQGPVQFLGDNQLITLEEQVGQMKETLSTQLLSATPPVGSTSTHSLAEYLHDSSHKLTSYETPVLRKLNEDDLVGLSLETLSNLPIISRGIDGPSQELPETVARNVEHKWRPDLASLAPRCDNRDSDYPRLTCSAATLTDPASEHAVQMQSASLGQVQHFYATPRIHEEYDPAFDQVVLPTAQESEVTLQMPAAADSVLMLLQCSSISSEVLTTSSGTSAADAMERYGFEQATKRSSEASSVREDQSVLLSGKLEEDQRSPLLATSEHLTDTERSSSNDHDLINNSAFGSRLRTRSHSRTNYFDTGTVRFSSCPKRALSAHAPASQEHSDLSNDVESMSLSSKRLKNESSMDRRLANNSWKVLGNYSTQERRLQLVVDNTSETTGEHMVVVSPISGLTRSVSMLLDKQYYDYGMKSREAEDIDMYTKRVRKK